MMMFDMTHCDCTMKYEYPKMKGKATEMSYKGEGVFVCPSCNKTTNYGTHKVKVEIKNIEGYNELSIIDVFGDDFLLSPVQEEYPERLNKDAMEEDFNEDCNINDSSYEHPWLKEHKTGIFILDVYWHWYRCSYEYEEYDLDMFIFSEQEVMEENLHGQKR